MYEMQKQLDGLHDELDAVVSKFIVDHLVVDGVGGPKYMAGVISVLEELHVRTVIVTTMAFMQARLENNDSLITAALIRQFVKDCETDFTGNLRVNLMETIKNEGLVDDIFDANADLRREILSDNP